MRLKFSHAFAFGLAAFAFCASALSETKIEDGYTLKLKSTKDGGVYCTGDTAEFVLTVSKDGKPAEITFTGDISKDSVAPVSPLKGKTTDGNYNVVGKLAEPGVLRCRIVAELPSGKKVELLAGAAFDPKKINPSLPPPADFAAYWQKQREILDKIPMNAQMTPVSCKDADVELFDVKIDSFNGLVRGYYARPKGAKDGSCPAIILPHGAGVRSSHSASAIKWAKRGFIAMDFNAHGIENGHPKKFYDDLNKGELKLYFLKNKDSLEKSFFRTLYMRDMRAMDFMEAQPEWNKKDFAVYGTSQGGGQAIACAALNPKISFCAAYVPAMCDHTGAVVGRVNGWPRFLDKLNGEDPAKVRETSRYYDAMNFAGMIKCDTFFNIDLADNTCAPTSCFAAYNNVKARKNVNIVEEARHTVPPEAYELGEKLVVEHLKKAEN